MKTITHSQLIEAIKNIKGTRPVGIDSLTDAGLLKTGNPHKNVRKKARFVAMLGANYGAAVNRQADREHNLTAEEKFIPAPLAWGEWMEGAVNKIKTHKGKFYLRTQTTPGERRVRKAKVEFIAESGEKLDYQTVKPFIKVREEGARQLDHGNHQTVNVRDFSFDSIQKIRIGGETFAVIEG